MSEEVLFELIPIIIFYAAFFTFLFFAYRFLRRRKKRHTNSYDGDMEAFQTAAAIEDIKSIEYFGDRIIWNQYLQQNDKIIIYQVIEPRVTKNQVLEQLWKDVHYKVHGYEPNDLLNPTIPASINSENKNN